MSRWPPGSVKALKSLHEARRKPINRRRALLARMVEESRSKAGTPKRGQQELDFGAPGKETR
jgi:hypothetical protein